MAVEVSREGSTFKVLSRWVRLRIKKPPSYPSACGNKTQKVILSIDDDPEVLNLLTETSLKGKVSPAWSTEWDGE